MHGLLNYRESAPSYSIVPDRMKPPAPVWRSISRGTATEASIFSKEAGKSGKEQDTRLKTNSHLQEISSVNAIGRSSRTVRERLVSESSGPMPESMMWEDPLPTTKFRKDHSPQTICHDEIT